MTRLNVAILTHNALEYTQRCLASLAEHTRQPHSIYILDNGSTDGSVEWLRAQEAANLKVTFSRNNLGVPAGRNLLIYEILPAGAEDEFMVFLDNDVEVRPGWCEGFLDLFARRPEMGIAGAVGHRIIVHTDWRELLPCPEGEPESVDVVSGFCFWTRAETVQAVGLFDESLGRFWHEDDDYCIRALQLGYEVFALPDAPILHHAHKSGVAEEDLLQGGSPENQRYLVEKWRRLGCVDSDGRIIRGGH
jgi:GT2 family glycosyltransferase